MVNRSSIIRLVTSHRLSRSLFTDQRAPLQRHSRCGGRTRLHGRIAGHTRDRGIKTSGNGGNSAASPEADSTSCSDKRHGGVREISTCTGELLHKDCWLEVCGEVWSARRNPMRFSATPWIRNRSSDNPHASLAVTSSPSPAHRLLFLNPPFELR